MIKINNDQLKILISAVLNEKLSQSAINEQLKSLKINPIKLTAKFDTSEFQKDIERATKAQKPKIDVEGNLQFNKDKLSKNIDLALIKIRDNPNFNVISEKLNNIQSEIQDADKIKLTNLNKEFSSVNQNIRLVNEATKQVNSEISLGLSKAKLTNTIQKWAEDNSRALNLVGVDIQNILSQIQGADNVKLNSLKTEFEGVIQKTREANLEGKNFWDELKSNVGKFASWFGIGAIVAGAVREVRQAVDVLKEVDTYLTEISKTSDLTAQELKKLGEAAFGAANKYGATVQGYLAGVQEMSRAGFWGEHAEQLAELSILAQSAGDMTSETANKYLLATNAAYGYEGSVESLNAVLDSQNQVTNRNALNMEELAKATMIAGSQAAQSSVEIDEMTAAVGTMVATTQQGGDIAGRAFKGILMNLQQVSGELDGEIFDEESFKKIESTLNDVGVAMEIVVNGAPRMREPMEILKELAQVYNSLDDLDPNKAAIIADLGGKYRGNQLAALLANWETYEKILSDYTNASGSALAEAQKTADSWEGRLNQLTNTWNAFVQNFVSTDFMKGAITSGETFIKVLDGITTTLGPIPTLITAITVAMSVKSNAGKLNMPTIYEVIIIKHDTSVWESCIYHTGGEPLNCLVKAKAA